MELKKKKTKIIFIISAFVIISLIGLYFLFSIYLPGKTYSLFATKSIPSINSENIEKIECEYPSPQFPDPSIKCTLKINKNNFDLEKLNIEEKSLDECNSSNINLRNQGDLLMCGYLLNIDNNYDMSAVTVRELGENYVIYIYAFDY